MTNKEAISTINSLRLLVDSVARGKKRQQIHEAIDYSIDMMKGNFCEDCVFKLYFEDEKGNKNGS